MQCTPGKVGALVAAVALVSASSAAAQGTLWIVDDDGGSDVDFTDLPPAVAAAGAGSVIVVREGVYRAFTSAGASVVVFAEDGAAVEVSGTIALTDFNFTDRALLRGLRSPANATQRGLLPLRLRLDGDHGDVVVEECSFEGGAGGAEAAELLSCSKTAFVRCELRGADGAPGEDGGAALRSTSSIVRLYDSLLVGGAGAPASAGLSQPATAGGAGAHAHEFSIFVAGSELRGGPGGAGEEGVRCFGSGDGGAGLVIDGVVPELLVRDSTFTGGAPGPAPCGAPGAAGAALDRGTAMVTSYPAAARSFRAPAVLDEGDAGTWELDGQPDDFAVVFAGAFLDQEPFPVWQGFLFPSDRFALIAVGSLGPTGSLAFPIVAPNLPLDLETVLLHQQPVVLTSGSDVVLGTPSSTAIVRAPGR